MLFVGILIGLVCGLILGVFRGIEIAQKNDGVLRGKDAARFLQKLRENDG